MSKPIPLKAGDIFGKLIIIEIAAKQVPHTYKGKFKFLHKCLCACGATCFADGGSLRTKNRVSCGCEFRSGSRYISKLSISSLVRQKTYLMKLSAKKRGYEWKLTDVEASRLITSPCYYCGETTKNTRVDRYKNIGFYVNGIDRLDNSGGYTLINCVSCCRICNAAKGIYSLEDYINKIKQVYTYLQLGKPHSLIDMLNDTVTSS